MRASLLAPQYGIATLLEGEDHSDPASLAQITSAAQGSDVVVNCADADDLPLTEAVIKGMRALREQRDGNSNSNGSIFKPLLLHTSGTGVLVSTSDPPGSLTEFAKNKIYNDAVPADIEFGIAPTQPHRAIDECIFRAGLYGGAGIDAYIIAPSTIYGRGDGPVRRVSIQVPNVIRAAVRRRQTVVIGEGTNLWNNVRLLYFTLNLTPFTALRRCTLKT